MLTLGDGKTLSIAGSGSFTVELLSGTGLLSVQGSAVTLKGYSSGAVSLETGSSLDLGAAGNLTSLTLNAGTSVRSSLTSGTLDLGVLTVSGVAARAAGDVVVLSLTGVLDGLKLSASSVTGTLHIEVTDEFIGQKLVGTDGYQLFEGDGSAWMGHVVFDNATYAGRLKLSGNMVTLLEPEGLQWAGGTGNNTWDAATQNWKEGGAAASFENEDNVVFLPGEGVSTEVTLSGTLAPRNVMIAAGTGWVFSGEGSLNASGKISVGGEGDQAAQLTLSGTGAVHSEGLSLEGEGTKLTITSGLGGSDKFNFKHMEIGEGAELVLQGAAAANHNHWTLNGSESYASGSGSIVLEGAGVLSNGMANEGGILWAFFGNTDVNKERIGNLKLRRNGETTTTLALNAEQGNHNANENRHGLGVLENLWVGDGCSLVVRSRAMGFTQEKCTLHLTGDGSRATYTKADGERGGIADAALVLGYNVSPVYPSEGQPDQRCDIYWNVAVEGNTSISVQTATNGDAYEWTLMKELNVGKHTLTKKGAGTLKMDAGSTLVGGGSIVVSEGLLTLAGGVAGFTGHIQAGTTETNYLAFNSEFSMTAGFITVASTGTLQFGKGTNFAAGGLTVNGSLLVTGGATLTGDGVINVAEQGTLSLAAETYSGMHVRLLNGSGTTEANSHESTLELTGGSFTGRVDSINDRGTIKITGATAGEISITGDTMLRVANGVSFTGTITLTDEAAGQMLGVLGGGVHASDASNVHNVVFSSGKGVIVGMQTEGDGVVVAEVVGLSGVWVGGPAGSRVSIGTLTASGENHSFTMDNGMFSDQWPDGVGGGNIQWAGNSGQVRITGDVTGYNQFTARRKGTKVQNGLDLIFSGNVDAGDSQEVIFNATYSEHDNLNEHNKYATILFDTESSLTGTGNTIRKQGEGTLALAGTISGANWAMVVQAGNVELGKSEQAGNALEYSFTGLTMEGENTMVEYKGACNLTLTGALQAQQGKIKISAANSSLTLHEGENDLGALELAATGATLHMGMSASDYARLQIGAFTPGGQTLSLALDGLLDWVEAQDPAESYELQLFGGDGVRALVAAIGENIEAGGFDCTLGSDGTLTIDASNLFLTWSGEGTAMSWTSQADGNVWGEGHDTAFDSTKSVTFAGTSTEPITVTLGEDITLLRGMTVKKGVGVESSQSYTFDLGEHTLSVGQNLSVEEGVSATFTGTGTVSSAGMSLAGSGTKLTINTDNSENNALYSFGHMELGEGTELVLQGANAAKYQHWTRSTNNYASGAGSIVLEGAGILQNGMSQEGILWAFFWNREGTHPGQTIGNLILRSYEGTGTTLFIDGEMGIETDHAIGVVENFWVEAGSSLVIKCRVLGKTSEAHSNTLHLKGNGSGASDGGVDADAALVLGTNGAGDGTNTERSKIYWNIKAESDASINVWVASTTQECAEWTLMKELNVGEYALTKKGAGTLKLDAGGTLVGTGDIVVENGALQVGASMSGYSGTIKVQGGSGLTLSADAGNVSVSLENGTAEGNVVNLVGAGALKSVGVGGSAMSGKIALAESAAWDMSEVILANGQTLTIRGAGSGETQSNVTLGGQNGLTLNGGTLEFVGVGATVSGVLSSEKGGGVKISGGAVLTANAGGTISELTADGGGLCVQASQTTVRVEALNCGTGGLTKLSIAAGATLDVHTGAITLKGELSWGEGARLNWGETGKITLGTGFGIGEAAAGSLRIHLTDGFMEQFAAKNGELDFFKYEGADWESSWSDKFIFETDDKRTYKNLRLNPEGHLTWDVKTGVQWENGDDTWTSGATEGWENVDDSSTSSGADGMDVHFAAEDTRNNEVKIRGSVSPSNVFVESGEYTFISDNDGGSENGGGLEIPDSTDGSSGVLVVGGDQGTSAKLTMGVANTNLPNIELEVNGTLVLASDGALTDATNEGTTDTTKIKFMGGVLEYSNKAFTKTDVSMFVSNEEGGSTAAVRVSVIRSVYESGVTWGSREATVGNGGNSGLTLALDETGIEKSGDGDFTLAWSDGGNEHSGAMTVQEGNLILAVEGSTTLSGKITGEGTLRLDSGTITLRGENDVKNVEISDGASVVAGGANALGGTNGTLTLDGGSLSGSGTELGVGHVEVKGDSTVSGVTLAGDVTGSAAMTVADGSTAGLSGDISEYKGTLKTGTSGRWQLSDNALGKEIVAGVAGDGTVEFTGDATYSGKVDGNVTLESSNEGTLSVTSTEAQNSRGAKLKGKITLGNSETQTRWNGGELVEGSITLANVRLSAGGIVNKGGAELYVNTAATGISTYSARAAATGGMVVDVNGMDAGKLDGIIINEDGQLTGVTGRYVVSRDKKLELHFGSGNVTANAGDGQALITGQDSFRLDVGDKSGLTLNLDSVIADILKILSNREVKGGKEVYLHLLDAGTLVAPATLSMDDLEGAEMLENFVNELSFDKKGNIKLVGSAEDVFVVNGEQTLEEPNILDSSRATLLDGTLTLNLDGSSVDEAIVHNLLGMDGSALLLRNSSTNTQGNRFTVALDNTRMEDLDPAGYPNVDGTTVQGQDTVYKGNLDAGEGVDVKKTGKGTLTVGGNYVLADGSTTIAQGALVLGGAENSLNDLEFDYEEAQDHAHHEKRGLVLSGGRTTISGSVRERGKVMEGNGIEINDGAELALTGESILAFTSITGDETGTLTLAQDEDNHGGSLTFTSNVGTLQLSGIGVNLDGEDTVLDLGKGISRLTELNGNGTLRSGRDGELVVSGGRFSGMLDRSKNADTAGTLKVEEGCNFVLDNTGCAAGTNGATAWKIELGLDSTLVVDVSKKNLKDPADKLILGDVNLGNGNMVVDFGKKVINDNALEATIVDVGEIGMLELHSDGKVEDGVNAKTGITVSEKIAPQIADHVRFTGAGNFLKDREASLDENVCLQVTTRDAEDNKFERVMPRAGKNGLAGAQMMWDSLKDKSQIESFLDAASNPNSDYAKLAFALVQMFDAKGTESLERALTAVAGASISTVGPALMEDVHRQLKAIRNRTTTMGSGGDHSQPFWHAWISGEGGYHKMDADGYLPGYSLNNWGGTLGIDLDVSARTTVGYAVSAMYGKLRPEAADAATGDLDVAYFSGFLRTGRGAWIHTFVASGGLADIKLDRTVNYGSGCYRTKGSTDGYAVGAMYEVGYTVPLGSKETVALQSVFNVEVRHAFVNGYTEAGSDAGLQVDDIEQDVVTFGMGARLQSIAGENAFNRCAIFEARMLAKVDAVDRSGASCNGIIGCATMAEVESAEAGAVGVEIGAGLTIPLGSSSGSIFMDASLEWRKGWSSVDASVGYRVNF